jgi:DNA-binding NarL/FixJ family response regulator
MQIRLQMPGLSILVAQATGLHAAVPSPPPGKTVFEAQPLHNVVSHAAANVVFMDINLPGMDGVSCVRELAKHRPDTLCVMLTVYDNAEAVFHSLQDGACGYLQKPVKAKDLIAACREVMAGGSPMTAKIARLVVQAFRKPASVWPRLAIIPWGGRITDAMNGTAMEVDYVRVYRKKP